MATVWVPSVSMMRVGTMPFNVLGSVTVIVLPLTVTPLEIDVPLMFATSDSAFSNDVRPCDATHHLKRCLLVIGLYLSGGDQSVLFEDQATPLGGC